MSYIVEEIKTDSVDLGVEGLTILDGRYIIFSESSLFNSTAIQPLISNDTTIKINGYELIGCNFPKLENKEPYYLDSLNNLRNTLTDSDNVYFIHRTKSNQKVINDTVIIKESRETKYRFINGYVLDGETVISDGSEMGQFPVYELNENLTYFIENGVLDGSPYSKIHLIKLDTDQYEVGEGKFQKYVSVDTINIPKAEQEIIAGEGNLLTNTSIVLRSNVVGDYDVNEKREGLLVVKINYEYLVSVYTGFIKYNIPQAVLDDPEYTSRLDDLTKDEGDTPIALEDYILNSDLLSTGISSSLSNIHRTPNSVYDKYAFGVFGKLRNDAISSNSGLWSKPYWNKKLDNTDYPATLSFSSLKSFINCNYKFIRSSIDNVTFGDYDKADLVAGDRLNNGAAILGTILHYNSALYYKANAELVDSGTEEEKEALKITYRNQTTRHWLGTGLEVAGDEYRFTTDDISLIKHDSKKEGLRDIKDIFEIISTSTLVDPGDDFFAELKISDIYDAKDNSDNIIKTFDIRGYIDGITYKEPTTPGDNGTVTIFDVKSSITLDRRNYKRYKNKFERMTSYDSTNFSDTVFDNAANEILLALSENREPTEANGGLSKAQITSLKNNPGTKDRAQIVWYLYFIIKAGKIGTTVLDEILKDDKSVATTEEEILNIMNRSYLRTFYDMVRYKTTSNDPSNLDQPGLSEPDFDDIANNNFAFEVVTPSERLVIWYYFIKQAVLNMAEKVSIYESKTLNVNEIADVIKPVESPINCKWCDYRKSCPAHKESIEDEILNNVNNYSRPSYALTQRPGKNRFDDEDLVGNSVMDYIRLSSGEVNNISNLNRLSKIKYNSRKRDLARINKSYDTQVGSIYISSAVTGIAIVDTKRHQYSDTLRTSFPSVFRTEASNKEIRLSIRFNSAEKINSELRHIIAQFYAFPFISIRNPELTRTVLPFDANKDIYFTLADNEVMKHVKSILNLKGSNDDPDFDTYTSGSVSYHKNMLYKKTRLYYSLSGINISDVPNEVDTIDLQLSLVLVDITTISSAGIIEYLTDTHGVLMQHAWSYNSNTDDIRSSGSDNDIAKRVIKLREYKVPSSINDVILKEGDGFRVVIDRNVSEKGTITRDSDGLGSIYLDDKIRLLEEDKVTGINNKIMSSSVLRLLNILDRVSAEKSNEIKKLTVLDNSPISPGGCGFVLYPYNEEGYKSSLNSLFIKNKRSDVSSTRVLLPYHCVCYLGLDDVNVDIPIFQYFTSGYSNYSTAGDFGRIRTARLGRITAAPNNFTHSINPILASIDVSKLDQSDSNIKINKVTQDISESYITSGKIKRASYVHGDTAISNIAYSRIDHPVLWSGLYKDPKYDNIRLKNQVNDGIHISNILGNKVQAIDFNNSILNLDKGQSKIPSYRDRMSDPIPIIYDRDISRLIRTELDSSKIYAGKNITITNGGPNTYDIYINRINIDVFADGNADNIDSTNKYVSTFLYPHKPLFYRNTNDITIDTNGATKANSFTGSDSTVIGKENLFENNSAYSNVEKLKTMASQFLYIMTIIKRSTKTPSIINVLSVPIMMNIDESSFESFFKSQLLKDIGQPIIKEKINNDFSNISIGSTKYYTKGESGFIDQFYYTIKNEIIG
jgi:hypothetical protein